MLRGEKEFTVGMSLLLVGPWIGEAVGNLLHPATVAICVVGILLILRTAFDTAR